MNSGKIILLDSVLQWTGVGYMVKKQEDSTLIKDVFRSSRFCMLLLSALYVVALAVFCVMYSIIPGPEFIFLVFLIYAVYNKRSWNFLKEWLPLITVFVSYQLMYSLVGTVAQNNLNSGPYELELQLFGQIPSVFLQQNFRFEFWIILVLSFILFIFLRRLFLLMFFGSWNRKIIKSTQ